MQNFQIGRPTALHVKQTLLEFAKNTFISLFLDQE